MASLSRQVSGSANITVLSILSRHFLDERAITVFPGAVLNPVTQQAAFMSVTGSGHLKRPGPSSGRLTGTVQVGANGKLLLAMAYSIRVQIEPLE